VQTWNGSAYATNGDTRFLYDGWNLLAEYNGMNANALVRSYVWGPDLSGSLQGAGGVGGLLWATVAPGSTNPAPGNYAPAYDGNGNIVAWIDLADSSVDGKRDYGAFGEAVVATGPAASLPFAFSTKYRDAETEMYYYGFRYNNPSTGRWLSRDPIGEEGGLNLYGHTENDPVNYVDPLGLSIHWQYVDPDVVMGKWDAHKKKYGIKDDRLLDSQLERRRGFEVWWEGDVLCKNRKKGKVALVQYRGVKPDGSGGEPDNNSLSGKWPEECPTGGTCYRQPAYTDAAPGKPPGMSSGRAGGYIDSPSALNQTFRVEAWVRCDCEDDRLIEKETIEVKYSRN
jgi:RHS repeat-associated protein